MKADHIHELHIEDRKYTLDPGFHVLYAESRVSPKKYRKKSTNIKKYNKQLHHTISLFTLEETIKNRNAEGILGILCASVESTSIIGSTNPTLKTLLNMKPLKPYHAIYLKNNDKITIGDSIIIFNIKKNNNSDINLSSANNLFWNATNSSPSVSTFLENSYRNSSKSALPKIDNNIHEVLTQVFEESDINDQPTQILDIHEVPTQPYVYSTGLPTDHFSLSNKKQQVLGDEDDLFTEQSFAFDQSQNLLDDYNEENYSCTIDRVTNSLSVDKTVNRCSNFNDDSSTDTEEHIEILKAIKTPRDICNGINSYNLHDASTQIFDKIDQDPFDAPTQIIPDFKINIKPAIAEEPIVESIDDGDPYEELTQIIPEFRIDIKPAIAEEPIVESINDRYPDEELTQIIIHEDINDKLKKCQTNHTDEPFDALTQKIDFEKVDDAKKYPDIYPMLPPSQLSLLRNKNKRINKDNLYEQSLSECLNQSADIVVPRNIDNEPFYDLTQQILNDLTSPSTKVTSSFIKSPKKRNTESNNIAIQSNYDTSLKMPNVSNKLENFYNSTQEVMQDLMSQQSTKIDVPYKNNNLPSTKILNVVDKSKEVNISFDYKQGGNIIEDDEIPCSQVEKVVDKHIKSQSQSRDSFLSPIKFLNSESLYDSENVTPIKLTNILDIELPDSQEIKQHTKHATCIVIPESDSGSDTHDESEKAEPSVVFKRKMPIKTKKATKKLSNSKSKNVTRDCYIDLRKKNRLEKSILLFEEDSNKGNMDEKKSKKRKTESKPHLPIIKKSRTTTKESISNCHQPVTKSYKVMFTGCSRAELVNAVISLGGQIVENNGDVLIAGKISRTFKSLMAISMRTPIVSTNWLTESEKRKQFLDPVKYLLRDTNDCFPINQKVLLKTKANFLKGYTIYMTPKISPTPSEMKQLIEVNGGKCINCKPGVDYTDAHNSKSFSITCPLDRRYRNQIPRPHYTEQVIVKGILQQALDLQANLLYK